MSARLEKTVNFLGILILFTYPLFYWNYFAGDAGIHLVYGQNAAAGHLFEFNLGEKSSGETSTGYMLLLAAFFRLLPAEYVPIAMKFVNYSAWFLLLLTFFRILQYKRTHPLIILAAILTAGLLPGSVYNSVIGMENVIFAYFALLWFYWAIKCAYFKLDSQISRTIILAELLFGFSMGICLWIRPEAGPFFILAISTRLIGSLIASKNMSAIFVRTALSLISFLIPCVLLLLFNYVQNGTWIPDSVQTRAVLVRTGLSLGPFIIDPKALSRIAIYFPITIFWLFGVFKTCHKNWQKEMDDIFAIVLFAVFILLFTIAIGAGHLGRYMIFLVPFWVLIATKGLAYVINRYRQHYPTILTIIFIIFTISLIAIYVKETILRSKLGGQGDFLTFTKAPLNRKIYSDKLYQDLGSPAKLPIVLACGEVQIRYQLDRRFIIRSLDGRTDMAMLKYMYKNYYDYIGYVKERGIDYFIADYAADLPTQNHFSRKELLNMSLNETFELKGVKFTSIGRLLLKVDR